MAGSYGPPLLDFSALGKLGGNFIDAFDKAKASRLDEAAANAIAASMGGQNGQTNVAPTDSSLSGMSTIKPAAQSGNLSSLGTASGMNLDRAAAAIAKNESGGNYNALGPKTNTGDQAFGKYQVMGQNVGPWTEKYLGKAMTPQEFLANPEAQEAVFKGEFGRLAQKYGNEGAARAWFAGEGGMNNMGAKDALGTTVAQYAGRFSQNSGAAPRTAAVASAPLLAPDQAGPQAPVQVAQTTQADLPAPNAQAAQGFVVPSTGQAVPASSPSLPAATSGAALPTPPSSSGPTDAQRATIAAMIRSPTYRAAGLQMLANIQSKKSFSAPFSYQGGTFQLGSDGELHQVIAPNNLTTTKDDNGNLLSFDPRTGRTTQIAPGQDKSFTDLVTPEERAAAHVDPSYTGPVQRDANGALKFPGKATSEVNLPGPEKAYDSTLGAQNAKYFGETQAAGRAAGSQLNTLGAMNAMLNRPDFYSGTGAGYINALKKAGASLGVTDADAASSTELFNKLANQFILDKAGGSLGTGFSNADRDFMSSTVANPNNTKEGNRLILGVAQKVAQRNMLTAKMARDYAKDHGGRLDAGFDDVVADFAEKHPLFADLAAPAPATTPQPQPGASQPQPRTPPAPAGGTPTAVNPKTGERLQLDPATGKWVPFS